MHSLMTGEGASAMQFAGQQSLHMSGRFVPLMKQPVTPHTVTLIADDWQLADDRQLASPYALRVAASFKER